MTAAGAKKSPALFATPGAIHRRIGHASMATLWRSLMLEIQALREELEGLAL
jgi:hypothetical protein